MRCEECRADGATLRCSKCKIYYCSKTCQAKNWRIHKRVCTPDQALRPFVPVEMAVERVLAKLPRVPKAPKEATCYICLQGNDGGKLMRGCACRGDSAGFVHLECLTKLAESKEASDDRQTVFAGWIQCGNCKQIFTGALDLEMARRYWRRHRSSQDLDLRYHASRSLATSIGFNGEVDAANQLLDEASSFVGFDKAMLLELKLNRAEMRIENGQKLEGLGLLQAILPEAKAHTANPYLYSRTMLETVDVLLQLGRDQEAHEMATEVIAFAKAKFGPEDTRTLEAVRTYAITCARVGNMEESKTNFEYVLTTQTRVLGRDHPCTQGTRDNMQVFGFLPRV